MSWDAGSMWSCGSPKGSSEGGGPLTSGPKAWILFGQISQSHHRSSSSGIPWPVAVGPGVSWLSEESSRGSVRGFGWSTSLRPSAPLYKVGTGK